MPESPTIAPPPSVVAPWGVLTETDSPLRSRERVLVVSAHPDDETIGAGRLLAGHDGPVAGLTLTLGERCVPALDAGAMGRRRYDEWRAALAELGVGVEDSGRGQRWPDGELAGHESDLTDLLVEQAAGADVLVTTWRHDPHPDHQAAGRAAAAAVAAAGIRLVEFPVWAPYWTGRDAVHERGYRATQVRSTVAAGASRDRALAAYASQTGTLLTGVAPIVSSAMLERHPQQIVMCPR